MDAIVPQLNSLLPKGTGGKREGTFPLKVRKLSVELASLVGVRKASEISGINQGSIYGWIKKGIYGQKKKLNSGETSIQSPLVLQEIDISSTEFFQKPQEIRLVSSRGVAAHLPADKKTLTLLLDRMMEVHP